MAFISQFATINIMSKWFWIILVVVVAGLLGIFAFTGSKSSSNNASSADPHEITASDNTEGPADAKVTFVEYGDFQCPACAGAYPFIKQAREDYKDKVRFVFRNFPLTNIHPNALAAARAAEAAGMQGQFFAMHDLLYENQKEWSESTSPTQKFEEYAKQLGLDVNKYTSDVNSAAVRDAINDDVAIGKKLGVNSTPTFYLNGKKVEPNPRSYDELKTQLDKALNQN